MRFIFIFLFLFFTSAFPVKAADVLSLEEKIELLFDIKSNDYGKKKAVETIRNYCVYLKKYDKQSEKVRVKKVFADIKKKHLTNYRYLVFFPDLFISGVYNCVTGTALIAIIFDELKIPYSIVKVPSHVYLIAYPNSHKIGVESTKNKDGVFQWNDYSKRMAVNYLLRIEKISESDIRQNSIDVILDRHFYVSSELTFKNLIGIHYINRALELNTISVNKKALKFIEKALKFDKSEQTKLIYSSILVDLLSETESDQVEIVDYLTKYYNIENKRPQRDKVEGSFEYCIYQAFKERDDTAFINRSIAFINKNLDFEKDRDLFISSVELERSEWLMQQGQSTAAYKSALKGYQLNNTNKRFEKLISYFIADKIYDEEPDESDLDSIFDSKIMEFPFLSESFIFQSFRVICFSYLISDAFFLDDEELGKSYLKKIQPIIDQKKYTDEKDVSSALSYTYGNIASFYFREIEIEQANYWINKALELNPDSKLLNRKKAYIDNHAEYYKGYSSSKLQNILEEFEDIEDEDGETDY